MYRDKVDDRMSTWMVVMLFKDLEMMITVSCPFRSSQTSSVCCCLTWLVEKVEAVLRVVVQYCTFTTLQTQMASVISYLLSRLISVFTAEPQRVTICAGKKIWSQNSLTLSVSVPPKVKLFSRLCWMHLFPSKQGTCEQLHTSLFRAFVFMFQ